MIICPTCNSKECIIPSSKILTEVYQKYMACPECQPDRQYRKDIPFHKLQSVINYSSCNRCGKRHLDVVIAHVLNILIEEDLFDEYDSLRDVGTPLISIGYPIPYTPRLGNNDLILIMDRVDQKSANRIVDVVPEIKGVIKRVGLPSESIGILDTDRYPHVYELLAGCDMRGDIVNSIFGELCIYKTQSKIHIEFPREKSVKINKLEQLYITGDLSGVIVDGFCGPGTLGLMCVLAGVEKVILNDLYKPAIENTLLNLEANKEILQINKTEQFVDIKDLQTIGDDPILVSLAILENGTEIEIYQGDFRKLQVHSCDICLIDTFPSVNPTEFEEKWKIIAKKVVVL
ncbi:MAG TPA: hypothetical protein EYP22_11255 [Methanosarcinales archaeon]|nr:hypothetical protein [Methanosarcinales archaeon]